MKRLSVAIAVSMLAPMSFAASAHAGSYLVYACGGPAGGAQNAFNAAADPLMSAYSICPSTGYVGTGIVTKATSSGGTARHLAGAYQVFDAPAGAWLDSVVFHVGALRFARYWTVGIVAYDEDFNSGHLPYGCYANGPGCDLGANVFYGPVWAPLYGHRHFRFESRCGNPGGCDVSYSGGVPGNRALFAMSNVTVRVGDDSPPSIQPESGALWQGGWHRGREQIWSRYADNVGIMATRLQLDGRLRDEQDYRDPRWPGGVRCDFTFRRPCHDITPGGFEFDTRELGDGSHTVRVEAIDAAGNPASRQHTIVVDNTAPQKLTGLDLAGGEGWRRSNSFDVGWSPPSGQVSPLARAHYRICRAGSTDCLEGEQSSIDHLANLAVPAAGDYTLRVWLADAAGNVDPEHASDPVHMRFDDRAPSGAFQPSDEADPLAVRAQAVDRESGLARATVELRPIGGHDWHELDTSFENSLVSARIDDLALEDGIYELRLSISDRAANEATVGTLSDGSAMRLRLPLRGTTRIGVNASGQSRPPRCRRLGRARKHRKRRRRCRARSVVTVAADGRAELKGELKTVGEPIAGATIAVVERARPGGPALRSAAVRSDERGRFSYQSPGGPSRSVTFDYAGSNLTKPAHERFELRVPARTSIAASPKQVSNGGAVTFAGRLKGGFVPQAGKLLGLEAYYRGRWRTFATPRTGADGSWRYRYRFGATVGSVLYSFRARIPFESAYPFETAYSPTIRVRVRG